MTKKSILYNGIKQITPPIIFSLLKKIPAAKSLKKMTFDEPPKRKIPEWHTIQNGELRGNKIFVHNSGIFSDMLSESYDDFFFNYLKNINLEGKTVFDIGAHIGFHTLFFAKKVGPKGKVLAFEPNTYNKERMEMIVAENENLARRIEVLDLAISEKTGEEDFIFTDNVDGGTSTGSFIDSAHTFWEKEIYEERIGFVRTKVKTVSLDDMEKELGKTQNPALIKIDVEGAEYSVIRGAEEFLKKHRPILLIEIHSIFNMLEVYKNLVKIGYKIELLKEEKDGRCFIAAKT